MMFKYCTVIFVALAAGSAVGSGFVAFIAVLGIIPRLIQLTKSENMLMYFEWASILGVIAGSFIGLHGVQFALPPLLLIFIGLFFGVFVGMLAAALYEVLNVFPIIAKRIQLEGKIYALMTAIVLGKVFGSLYYWLGFLGK